MLLMECRGVKKYFGDRLILDVENLKIYSEDRIGIVGVNGAGKTTLLNILCGKLEPDEGWVKFYGSYSYISQLEAPARRGISSEVASKFNVPAKYSESMSGGEKTRYKVAESLSSDSQIIFADEPTSNVDMEGIEIMEEKFLEYKGALVLISHDRSFLDRLCSTIWELEDGKVKVYKGNYSDYAAQKAQERERAQFEYEQYKAEKERLKQAIIRTKQRSQAIKKPPKRMGNSEARLHKMGGQKAKAVLERAAKNIQKRIEHLEVKEKPMLRESIKLDTGHVGELYSRVIIEGRGIYKAFGENIIFDGAEFSIYNGSKVALIGPNGCGKSTLIKMILEGHDSIRVSKGAKIGYFSQDMSILKENLTVMENVMESSIYPETAARTLLARLLINGDDVYKKICVLSGGERVKVSFAKILLGDVNLLILDEPTNYMDISSLEVMEGALKDYDRTLLFVSHDRRFIEAAADHIMTIEGHKIKMFKGSYREYLDKESRRLYRGNEEIQKEIFILENRLSEIIGRLSMPSKKDDLGALDREYHEVVGKIKKLKKEMSTPR